MTSVTIQVTGTGGDYRLEALEAIPVKIPILWLFS